MKQYFVTGTNTDVGKTLVSAILCENLKADYFKPIQTGSHEILDANTISTLTDAKIHKNSYCLEIPASPAFSAKQEGIEIKFENIKLPDTNGNNLIVEGAGGCMVPINSTQTTLDLIKYLNLPTVIVVKNELGCVSSALTTILALRSKNISIAGVILNGDYDPFNNYEAIEQYGKVDVLDKIQHFDVVDKYNIKKYKLCQKALNKLLGE
ncbi:MAG: dethiobiotin synthase [Rickettsiales bacterium]|nr:dethiobiotin synthase [Rickettsiales bacterium]